MPKEKKKLTLSGLPGSIFKRGNKWYITIGGVQRPTHIDATPEGLKIVQRIHKEAYLEYLQNNGKLPAPRVKIKQSFQSAWKLFIEYKTAKQLAKKSIYTYELSFRTLLYNYKNYLISEESLRKAAIELLNDRKYAPASKNIFMRHIQYFLNWCYDNKYIEEKIVFYSKYALDAPQKKFMDYEQSEFNAILAEAYKKDKEFYLFILFMLLSGSRLKETLELTWDNVDFENQMLMFPNKTKKTVIDYFPISEELSDLLQELKSIADKRGSNYKRNKLFKWESSSVSSLSRDMKKIEQRLNIKIQYRAFHGFRKTFANNMINANIDIYSLKDLMRHKNISTTMKHYKGYKTEKLRDILNQNKMNILTKK